MASTYATATALLLATAASDFVVIGKKQVLLSDEFIIFRRAGELICVLDDLFPTEVWSASSEGFNYRDVGSVGSGIWS